MTARERVDALEAEWGKHSSWTYRKDAIEKAITAAVEEEREACANILHEVYLAWIEGDYAPGEAFESAKEKIRHGARCNKSATEIGSTQSK